MQEVETFFDGGNFFNKVVRAAFAQRWKTLLNSLTDAGFSREKILSALEISGIDGSRRAETLSLEEFAKISAAIQA